MKVRAAGLRGSAQQAWKAVTADARCCTVLGRFLHSLNKFALEEYGLAFDICDYDVYEFAKARRRRRRVLALPGVLERAAPVQCSGADVFAGRRSGSAPRTSLTASCTSSSSRTTSRWAYCPYRVRLCSAPAHAAPRERAGPTSARAGRSPAQPAAPGGDVRSGGRHLAAALHTAAHAGVDRAALSGRVCRGALWQPLGAGGPVQGQVGDLQARCPRVQSVRHGPRAPLTRTPPLAGTSEPLCS